MPAKAEFQAKLTARQAGEACGGSYVPPMSESIRNIGRYMLMMITPTIAPTAIIMSGSMIDVSEAID